MKKFRKPVRVFSQTIILFLSINVLFAQKEPMFVCAYTASQINEKAICDMLAYRTRPEAQKAVENIVRRSGLKQNFYVMECANIDNCFAVTRNGERMIVYDGSFMRRVNNMAKSDWGAISILAHEIGHHLNGHTIKPGGSDPKRELEADEFSGFVMYQMGASLKEAQSAIWKLTSDYDTGSHPPRNKRMIAIKKGYENAQELYPRLSILKETVLATKRSTEEKITKKPKLTAGCLAGSCYNGYGVAINRKTREKYAGNWKVGKRSGYGIEFYVNGRKKYEGDLLAGDFHGSGTYFFKNGDKYIGGFKKGKKHDETGIYYYKNGDRLFVRYVNGKKEGRAKMIYYGGVEGLVYFEKGQEM